MEISLIPHTLRFLKPAHTSRETYSERKVCYVLITDGNRHGVGECAPLPKLSEEYGKNFPSLLHQAAEELTETKTFNAEYWQHHSSVCFGFESALRMFHHGMDMWQPGKQKATPQIAINGLIWMNSPEIMQKELQEKLQRGFKCIKIKIGAVDFKDELALIQYIRRHYGYSIEIRVDANGAFTEQNVFSRLESLAPYHIHSIEQPVAAKQYKLMEQICRQSPVPVAFDEELIGICDSHREKLLSQLKPHYIVLKPSLHGGFWGATKWIQVARPLNIGYWITSALESNVGLWALWQWTTRFHGDIRHGLGTGMLFENNIPLPLCIEGENLCCYPQNAPSAAELYHTIKALATHETDISFGR